MLRCGGGEIIDFDQSIQAYAEIIAANAASPFSQMTYIRKNILSLNTGIPSTSKPAKQNKKTPETDRRFLGVNAVTT